MKELRDALLVFNLKEIQNLTTGLPLDIDIINGLLWVLYFI